MQEKALHDYYFMWHSLCTLNQPNTSKEWSSFSFWDYLRVPNFNTARTFLPFFCSPNADVARALRRLSFSFPIVVHAIFHRAYVHAMPFFIVRTFMLCRFLSCVSKLMLYRFHRACVHAMPFPSCVRSKLFQLYFHFFFFCMSFSFLFPTFFPATCIRTTNKKTVRKKQIDAWRHILVRLGAAKTRRLALLSLFSYSPPFRPPYCSGTS